MPGYRYHVFVCTNERPPERKESCGPKGSLDLLRAMKARARQLGLEDVRINKSGCLAQCLGGVHIVIYPEGTWYHGVRTEDDVLEIVERHLARGEKVTRLLNPDGGTGN